MKSQRATRAASPAKTAVQEDDRDRARRRNEPSLGVARLDQRGHAGVAGAGVAVVSPGERRLSVIRSTRVLSARGSRAMAWAGTTRGSTSRGGWAQVGRAAVGRVA